jgi:hypothetical protein
VYRHEADSLQKEVRMAKTTSLTLAAVLVVAIAGAAPPALAQHFGSDGPQERMFFRHHDMGPRVIVRRMHRSDGLGAGLLAFGCSDRGADRLEHTLLAIEQRTDVTTAQRPLFDEFQSAAKAAQADFAAACVATRPGKGERDSLDLAERLNMRFEVGKAQVAAMEAVLPAFTAFYASLSDEQKAALEPRRKRHRRDFGMTGGPEMPATPEELPELIGFIHG